MLHSKKNKHFNKNSYNKIITSKIAGTLKVYNSFCRLFHVFRVVWRKIWFFDFLIAFTMDQTRTLVNLVRKCFKVFHLSIRKLIFLQILLSNLFISLYIFYKYFLKFFILKYIFLWSKKITGVSTTGFHSKFTLEKEKTAI